MRRKGFVGALLLVCVGVILGTTVFRDDIAQATGLAQGVVVTNTASQAVPVREQNLDGGNIKVHEQGVVQVHSDRTDIGFHASASGTPSECGNQDIYTVPSGKQFVMEFAAIVVGPGSSTTADTANVFGVANFADAGVAFIQLIPGTLGRWTGSQTLHLVFPSGTTVGFDTQPTDDATLCGGEITVGGYLEPAP